MTDARFSSEWIHRTAWTRLLPYEKLSFLGALAWCVAEQNDGVIGETDVDAIPDFDKEAVAALVGLGHLKKTRTGWQMTPFGSAWNQSQSTRKQLEARKTGNRRRQANYQARQRDSHVDE